MTLNEQVALVLGLVALVSALGAWVRWARPRWRGVKSDTVAMRDSLLGREAVVDSITGKELSPALPGIGQRVASLEESTAVIGAALARMADTNQRLDSHDQRLRRLEQAADERTLARTESIEMLRTIDTAIRADTKDE